MDETTSVIYGLELQARALTPQRAEDNEVRFFIATNSLKPTNQIHLVKFCEGKTKATINSQVFEHVAGEVWKLTSCPHSPNTVASCYNVSRGSQVQTQAALLTLPDELNEPCTTSEFIPWKHVEILPTEQFGEKVKTVEFHPSQRQTIACVVDGRTVVIDRATAEARIVAEISCTTDKKSSASFTSGKWSHHHQGNQFLTLSDCAVRSYDVRDTQHCAWSIESAHRQLVRDLDCNANKQCHIVTGGDDGCIKVWDCRKPKEPVFARNDHAHWVWSVRYNTFHDQLILSSSSDCKVLLTSAASVSSDVAEELDRIRHLSMPKKANAKGPAKQSKAEDRRGPLPDGLLQVFEQHEDSVYCAEWSTVDPWTFASLSYDGRAWITKPQLKVNPFQVLISNNSEVFKFQTIPIGIKRDKRKCPG